MLSISRKVFLKRIWWIILLPYLVILVLMSKRHVQVSKPKRNRIKNTPPEGISFHEDVISIRSGNDQVFFADRCTHLGCKINHSEKGMLVCPCHGSVFSPDGSVVKGPATKGLRVLKHETDPENGKITVYF